MSPRAAVAGRSAAERGREMVRGDSEEGGRGGREGSRERESEGRKG